MKSISATIAAILTLLEPLTAAVLAAILFHERLTPLGIFGAVLLLAAILVLAKAEPTNKEEIDPTIVPAE